MSDRNIILQKPASIDFGTKHKNTAQVVGDFVEIYDSFGDLICKCLLT
jgi:hypothetical protein